MKSISWLLAVLSAYTPAQASDSQIYTVSVSSSAAIRTASIILEPDLGGYGSTRSITVQ